MKRIVLLGALALIASPAAAEPVKVKGTVRSDGTYVPPHVRTSPNSTKLDNWSSKPNVNPYTGKTGTSDPWKPAKSSKPKY